MLRSFVLRNSLDIKSYDETLNITNKYGKMFSKQVLNQTSCNTQTVYSIKHQQSNYKLFTVI